MMEKGTIEKLVKIVEHYLNHKKQGRLGGRAPVEVMSPAIKRDNPMDIVFKSGENMIPSSTQLSDERLEIILQDVEEYLQVLHREINSMTERQRELALQ